MKKRLKLIVFTMILVLAQTLQAQLVNTYTTEMDAMFLHLDKTPITTGILIDRIFPAANLQEFNQGTRIDTTSCTHFNQAWSELYRAAYAPSFNDLEQLRLSLKEKNYSEATIPIGIVNTEFHQSNFGDTEATAKVTFDELANVFYNKPGINPFVKKQTTVIAPLVSKAVGNMINFKVDVNFKLHQQGKRIKTLQMLANGSTFTLVNNYVLDTQSKNTSYSSSGVKYLKFTITYSDVSIKTMYASIEVEVPSTIQRKGVSKKSTDLVKSDTVWADTDLVFQGYDENTAYRGFNEYRIYYDSINNNEVLNKPLIIIDGYDPGDERKIDESDFPKGANKNDLKHIKGLISYDHDNNLDTKNKDLVAVYQNLGYDVVIVNHPVYQRWEDGKVVDGGTDYLQRNAYTFISLLRKLKTEMQGSEEFVIIGPSMGGLVSRYALKTMENKLAQNPNDPTWQQKWDHNTRLWVSFDAPHQGANVPIGIQEIIKYIADRLETDAAKKFIKEQLDRPFTKQLLVNHYSKTGNSVAGALGFRDRFQQELDEIGYPQNLRKVDLLNGALNGALNATPEAQYLKIHSNIKLPFAGGYFFDARFDSNAKNNMPKEVFYGKHQVDFGWFGTYTDKRTTKHINANTKGSYDVGPGSFFGAQNDLANESEGETTAYPFRSLDITDMLNLRVNDFGDPNTSLKLFASAFGVAIDTNVDVFHPIHTFIPTKSALDFIGSNVLDENISNEDLVCAGKTPFDAYFAPTENQQHIFLTPENVAWLNEQLNYDGTAADENFYNQLQDGDVLYEVTGSDIVGAEETYSFGNCFETSLINWEITGNLKILSANSRSITVNSANPFEGGSGVIRARVGDLVFEKEVSIRERLITIPIVDYYNNKVKIQFRELDESGTYGPVNGQTLNAIGFAYSDLYINSYYSGNTIPTTNNIGVETTVYMPTNFTNEYLYGYVFLIGEYIVMGNFIFAPY